MFLKLFQNAMIRNIKIHNIFDTIEISKYMEPNKCTHKFVYKKVYLSVSYDFSKFNGYMRIKGVTLLVVPPKDVLAHVCEGKVTISNLNVYACSIASKVTWDPWLSKMNICLFIRKIPPNIDLVKKIKSLKINVIIHAFDYKTI